MVALHGLCTGQRIIERDGRTGSYSASPTSDIHILKLRCSDLGINDLGHHLTTLAMSRLKSCPQFANLRSFSVLSEPACK